MMGQTNNNPIAEEKSSFLLSSEQEEEGRRSRRRRRDFLRSTIMTSLSFLSAMISTQQQQQQLWVANAATTTTTIPTTGAKKDDGNNLLDLPPDAVRSYFQYRIPLQTSADFYLFELRTKILDIDSWGEINDLFTSNNNRGQGIPSRIEREFTNIMRVVGLSMPPDISDEMRIAQTKFDTSMNIISKATSGIRRDLPVEIDPKSIDIALHGWDNGRIAINEFFTALNDATGLYEMKTIPEYGPNQIQQYGRSERRYIELKKKIKLCQNRGGPTLSQAWGTLMISGYMQDSCGIPDLDDYFYQG